MRTDFIYLLFAITLYSLLCLNVNSAQMPETTETNITCEMRESDSNSHNTHMNTKQSRQKENRNSHGNRSDEHSNRNDVVGFHSSDEVFRLKYSNQRRSDIYTKGYQTFLGKRRRGSKSHVRTTFRRRSGYDYNGRKERSSTFESYGEADSFDRKKIRDVFDVNGYISEGRKRSKFGGYIQDERHGVMLGGHKSKTSRDDKQSSESRRHSEKSTHRQLSANHTSENIARRDSSHRSRPGMISK
ncbi:Trematode Eggshell Synthesis domain containing protein [Schistosoma mansoni]|uniref:Trematode Eggshell Synthesis domain containing protein n=1 Tax=Schistosoma mansoni TaxID=6183 RepID=G4LVR8_SCHMA|nr:Trematode Eggshell Synthesis domain containing protein [Schistosoma mansoni]|eukprot:XP_018645365.1 Trematode Eggshell Synthesis domain containing protein [Schistosoma mansoni]